MNFFFSTFQGRRSPSLKQTSFSSSLGTTYICNILLEQGYICLKMIKKEKKKFWKVHRFFSKMSPVRPPSDNIIIYTLGWSIQIWYRFGCMWKKNLEKKFFNFFFSKFWGRRGPSPKRTSFSSFSGRTYICNISLVLG